MRVKDASAPDVDDQGLWLPRVTYTNGDTRVELIGMAHMADQRFFDDVLVRLDEATHRGEKVCFEGIRQLTDQERSWLNQTQRDAIDTFSATLDAFYSLLPAEVGLSFQGDILRPNDENWIRTDMDQLELVRALGVKGVGWLRRFRYLLKWLVSQYPEGLPPEVMGRDVLIDMLGEVNQRPSLSLADSILRRVILNRRVIRDQRNDIGAKGILRVVSRDRIDVVATWGNAHLSGIGERLVTAGFRPVSRHRYLAIASSNPAGSHTDTDSVGSRATAH